MQTKLVTILVMQIETFLCPETSFLKNSGKRKWRKVREIVAVMNSIADMPYHFPGFFCWLIIFNFCRYSERNGGFMQSRRLSSRNLY